MQDPRIQPNNAPDDMSGNASGGGCRTVVTAEVVEEGVGVVHGVVNGAVHSVILVLNG